MAQIILFHTSNNIINSLTELKDSNKMLSEENDQLRGYIDRLLLGVLAHSPGVLEISTSPDSLQDHYKRRRDAQ